MKEFKGKAIYNPSGKAGEKIIQNGYYVLLMPSHPNSFGKGHVYEHRYLMEQKIGRLLLSSEIVHHIDGNKLNNNIDNLELLASIAEHKARHRSEESGLRSPGEENTVIECLCGCGRKFHKYDESGRPRNYSFGGCCVRHQRIIRQAEQAKMLIRCACGCGEVITKFDKYGRERKYISGHNAKCDFSKTEIAMRTGLSLATIINYFNNKKLRILTVRKIETFIIDRYGKDYLRK